MSRPSSTITTIPLPVLLSMIVAFVLHFVNKAAKAYSHVKGPLLWTVWFRPSRVDHEHRAIGLDMLFTALGAQIGFLVTEFLRGTKDTAPNALLEAVDLSIPQHTLMVRVFYGLVAIIVLAANVVRFAGYDTTSGQQPRLKEDWGILLPNLAGALAIMGVYLLGPLESG